MHQRPSPIAAASAGALNPSLWPYLLPPACWRTSARACSRSACQVSGGNTRRPWQCGQASNVASCCRMAGNGNAGS
eukprot:1579342-Alexandrium_andersonii.AAC.1